MGNSTVSTLKAAIINNSVEDVKQVLQKSSPSPILDELVNRKGDTPLMLAALLGRAQIVNVLLEAGSDVNHVNRDGCTALDLAIRSALPPDGDMLCKYRMESESASSSDSSEGNTKQSRYLTAIPEVISILLAAGAKGRMIERLILFVMREKELVKYVIESMDELASPANFRVSGLLLQVAVWFDQPENLRLLLSRGVDIQNFWSASFMPRIEPSNQSTFPIAWDEDRDSDEYSISMDTRASDPLQELKFCFVQEWWADWNEGENPCAQYRAGLNLTPDCALFFVRTANSPVLLDHIMEDIMQYLPHTCSGPDLKDMCLFNCLTMAGYVFHVEQQQHLSLKFNIDFEPHRRFNKQPKKLRHLCRMSIRFMFRTNVHSALMTLPELPIVLKDFLLLESDIHL